MEKDDGVRLAIGDAGRAETALGRAFEDYPLIRYALPDDRYRLRAATCLYGAIVRYCLAHGEVFTTPDVAGVACWLPPGGEFPTFWAMVRAGMLRVPFRFGWTGFRRLNAFDAVAQRLHRVHAAAPQWYLWAIGVEPSRQGQGVGRRLVHPILARADAAGLPCYLETHKEKNVGIYERFGFRVVAREGAPGHPGTLFAMARPPAGVAKPA